MKKLLFLLIATLLFASCDDTREDSLALVGTWETYWTPPQMVLPYSFIDISQTLILERGGKGTYIIKRLWIENDIRDGVEVIKEYKIASWHILPDNTIVFTEIAQTDGRKYTTMGEYIVTKDRLAIFFNPLDAWAIGKVHGAPFNRVD